MNTNESLDKRSETIVSRNPKRILVESIINQNSKKISSKDMQHDCDIHNSKSVANFRLTFRDKSESKSLADKNIINKSETETFYISVRRTLYFGKEKLTLVFHSVPN